MSLRHLTSIELADLLDDMYREDRGIGSTGPDPATQMALANFLVCHPEVQAQAWKVWQELLLLEGELNADDAAGWLHVECGSHPRT